ncbi:MAG: hypothetical protein JWR44_2989 [Hymenobacter sp.]|jgi:hypothetical protein|nr:hypothetical protein [Hymenobacter sp.]
MAGPMEPAIPFAFVFNGSAYLEADNKILSSTQQLALTRPYYQHCQRFGSPN